MTRTLTLIAVFLAISLSLALFHLKYRVQDLEGQLRGLELRIHSDREAIHVLKAEWSHLNDPARLRDLARRHLKLEPMRPDQMSGWQRLPEREFRTADLEVDVQDAEVPHIPANALTAGRPDPKPPSPKTVSRPPAAQAVDWRTQTRSAIRTAAEGGPAR